MSKKEITVGRWVPKFVIEIWNMVAERHNARPKIPPEEKARIIREDARQSENNLLKFTITMNGGALLATLALVGQVKDNISKPELITITEGVTYFIIALIALGFGMIMQTMSHYANWGGFLFSHALFRLVFLGLSAFAFYYFIEGTVAVTTALLIAF